jgi:hypothetical protein
MDDRKKDQMEDQDDRIRRRAHELWESEGKPENRAGDHWTEAKRQIEKEDRVRDSRDADIVPHPPKTSDPLHVTGVQTTAKKTSR